MAQSRSPGGNEGAWSGRTRHLSTLWIVATMAVALAVAGVLIILGVVTGSGDEEALAER